MPWQASTSGLITAAMRNAASKTCRQFPGPKASAMERRQPGSSDRGDINREIARHNAHRRKVRQLRAKWRRLMQRQAPRAREFSPRLQIGLEARQASKHDVGYLATPCLPAFML
jgi:hypothetical protein